MKHNDGSHLNLRVGDYSIDPELKRMIRELPEDTKLSDVMKVLDKWEERQLHLFRLMERGAESYPIDTVN